MSQARRRPRPGAKAAPAVASAPAAQAPATQSPQTQSPAPVTLHTAVGLLAAESAGLAVVAGIMLRSDLAGGASSQQGAIGVISYVAVLAAVLALLARALHRRRAWARGPAIVLHLLMFPLGIAMITNGLPLPGVVAALLGVTGAALLIAPSTRAAVGRE